LPVPREPRFRDIRSSLKRLVRNAAIVLAVSLTLVLVLELGLRLFFPQRLDGTSLQGEHFSEGDPSLGIRYLPGAIWRFRHPEYTVEYAINADGFRDAKPHPTPKPTGTRRVLLLGDSFTFGQGVNYEDAWPVVAEREFERRIPGQVDLVKAGVQGADTRSELILLRRHARRLHVDVIVLGFLINDVYTNVPYESKPHTELAKPSAAWSRVRTTVFRRSETFRTLHLLELTRRLVTSVDAAYIALYMGAPGRGEFLKLPLGEAPRRQIALTERLLDQMAAYCDSIGAPLIVLSIPQQFQVLYLRSAPSDSTVDVHLYDRHFSAYAARRGFMWVPTLKAFHAADTTDTELFYRLDGHLTLAGNAVLADVFLREVAPSIIPPLGYAPPSFPGAHPSRRSSGPE
jgi:lysophospholipase L1-like esterase